MLQDKLDEIAKREKDYRDSHIDRAVNSSSPIDYLIGTINNYTEEVIKLKQKLEIIKSTVSEQYYK
jgi:hypothetical protein